MNDIDLDELHQAVSAMMDDGKKPKTKKAKTEAADSKNVAQKVQESSKQIEKPVQDNEKTEDTHVPVNRPRPQVAPRARLRGAAMDIVQPRAPGRVTPPSARAARTAASLQPTRPITPEPARSEPQQEKQSISAPAESPAMATVQPPTSPAEPAGKKDGGWPDPLDFHDDVTDDAQTDAAPTMTPASRDEPATSPFVTTKVEKRPLGAYAQPSAAEQAASAQPEPEAAMPDEPEAPQNNDEPQPAMPQQPEEFSPEVVAVESADTANHKPQSDTTHSDDLRQMPIPPQYHAKDQPPSQQTRPVFDTKEYHAPAQPVHAAHRTSSAWGWVLIIMLVLLLVAAGLIAYFAMMGELNFDITGLF